MTRIQYDRLLTACARIARRARVADDGAELAASVWLACQTSEARAWTLANGDERQLRSLAWSVQRDEQRSQWSRRRRELTAPLHAQAPLDGFEFVARAELGDTLSERARALVARVECDGVPMATVAADVGVSVATAYRVLGEAREILASA